MDREGDLTKKATDFLPLYSRIDSGPREFGSPAVIFLMALYLSFYFSFFFFFSSKVRLCFERGRGENCCFRKLLSRDFLIRLPFVFFFFHAFTKILKFEKLYQLCLKILTIPFFGKC